MYEHIMSTLKFTGLKEEEFINRMRRKVFLLFVTLCKQAIVVFSWPFNRGYPIQAT
jgi:hypothetical protein